MALSIMCMLALNECRFKILQSYSRMNRRRCTMESNKSRIGCLEDVVLYVGFENFGFTRDGSCTVYREWAPAAA